MWSVEPEDGRALRRVVAADALEDARCRSAGRARRRGPSRRPSRRARRSSRSSRSPAPSAPFLGLGRSDSTRGSTRSTARARASRRSSAGAIEAMCAGDAGADPDHGVREQRPVDQDLRDGAVRERRHARPARTRSPRRTSSAPRDPHVARAGSAAATGRLVGAPVARDEREHVARRRRRARAT